MSALQRHYTVQEVAEAWGLSEQTIYRLFDCEPGVLRITSGKGKRTYTTVRIPEESLSRVHARLTGALPLGRVPQKFDCAV